MDIFYKYTHGFVSQCFELQDGKWVFVGQSFTAGDPVNFEDDLGNVVAPDDIDKIAPEPYQPFDMVNPVKPELKWFVLELVGCVEPIFHGPFADEKVCQDTVEAFREDPKNSENSYTSFRGSEVAL